MNATHPKHGGANVRVPPPLVFLACILLGVIVQHFEPVPLELPIVVRMSTGTTIAVFGSTLIAWAFGLFKRSSQDPAPWKPSPALLFDGPYRFTRNPMYVGMTSIVAGLGLALGNPWLIGLAAVGLAIVHVAAVLPEERYLTARFGEDYTCFKSKVRRYL